MPTRLGSRSLKNGRSSERFQTDYLNQPGSRKPGQVSYIQTDGNTRLHGRSPLAGSESPAYGTPRLGAGAVHPIRSATSSSLTRMTSISRNNSPSGRASTISPGHTAISKVRHLAKPCARSYKSKRDGSSVCPVHRASMNGVPETDRASGPQITHLEVATYDVEPIEFS